MTARRRPQPTLHGVLTGAALGVLTVLVAFPFYWMVLSSTKSFSELFSIPPTFWPGAPSWRAYVEVLVTHRFYLHLWNSLRVAAVTVALNVALATLAAYALARLRFRGKGAASHALLLIYMLPPILLLVPLFVLLSFLGLRDTLAGLVIAYLAQTLPVSIYMLGNYFRAIPPEIEESAMVDGCTRLQVIRRVTLPLSLPALSGVAVYTFMIAWNEFLFAYILLDTPRKFTLSKGLYHLFGSYHTAWDVVMAASVVMTVPVLLVFLLFQRQLVSGLTAGGVKG
ncbi:MAG: carbohydrate ABC transporter permease [Deferrisomatales bacterium]|nr:carbohydrate ABC transporter permease [Deferrisomatales bacterium]